MLTLIAWLEMTFRAPGVVPPIVLLDPETTIPDASFGRPALPTALVPMKLPSTVAPEPLSVMPGPGLEPPWPLPEIRLQAPVQAPPGVVPVVPPIRLLPAALTR